MKWFSFGMAGLLSACASADPEDDADYQGQIDALTTRVEDLTHALETSNTEDLSGRLEVVEGEVTGLQDQVAGVGESVTDLQGDVSGLWDAVTVLEATPGYQVWQYTGATDIPQTLTAAGWHDTAVTIDITAEHAGAVVLSGSTATSCTRFYRIRIRHFNSAWEATSESVVADYGRDTVPLHLIADLPSAGTYTAAIEVYSTAVASCDIFNVGLVATLLPGYPEVVIPE